MIERVYWGAEVHNQPKADTEAAPSQVFRTGYAIYFNGIVNTANVNQLMNLSRGILAEASPNGKPDYLLYINSPGGYVTEMFRFIDFLETEVVPRTAKQTSVVHGIAMSAASLIAASFQERLMTKRSTIMIHELGSFLAGRFSIMSSEFGWLTKEMDKIVDIYSAVMNKSRPQIEQLLQDETYLGAQEALKLGLITKVI